MQESRNDIIEKIVAHVNKKLPEKQARLVDEFIKQYYAKSALDDLQAHDVLDLYGAALSHWNLIYQRAPGEAKIHIYNPQFEQHGWQSTHTIIEVSHDDMPFLVDSLRMEVNRRGYNTHLMIHLGGMKVKRDSKHQITEILPFDEVTSDYQIEAPIYIEIDRESDLQRLEDLRLNLLRVLKDVRLAVTDWEKMRHQLKEVIKDLQQSPPPLEPSEINESIAFLEWLLNNHFTFIGFRRYTLHGSGDDMALHLVKGSGLGVLRDDSTSQVVRPFSSLPPEAKRQALSPQILIISKTNTKSTVHRPAYTDIFSVKTFAADGAITGECRFIGLYTSTAYNSNPKHIPFLRHKVAMVVEKSKLPPQSHSGKELINILETLPRDDLFQASAEELYDLAMGILSLQERKRIRLFVRKDIYSRFVSCLVYIPSEDFNTDVLYAMQNILRDAFQGLEVSFSTRFSESVLARIHFVLRINPNQALNYDIREIETKLADVGRSWHDKLVQALQEHFGEERGNILAKKYEKTFPASYRESYLPRTAIYDIEHIEALTSENSLGMSFYRPLDEPPGTLRFKLFLPAEPISLSEVLPILENMGLTVMGERPHQLTFKDETSVWINDFGMMHAQSKELDVEVIKDIFQEAFRQTWYGLVENDGFNRLVLGAGLSSAEVNILRAYSKYLRQTGFTFSQPYIEESLAKNAVIVKQLVELFKLYFDPHQAIPGKEAAAAVEKEILSGLDSVANLDEDRILRRYLDVIKATLRTNFYQKTLQGQSKLYLSFKFDPSKIPELPLPRPKFEVFVYSRRFEGVHLRGAYVARGGIRWSDRREDFRTEILGLMKAQQVKNAVIVPSGAKGGFVPKNLPADGSREAILEEVIICYQNFIRGLLDLTDNLVNNAIIPPQDTVRYDGDDAYLVVAADKGTATFSDIANQISKEYNYWLGDAFASGGSAGYDHKKMGITARGAWESVKRFFREIGINTQDTNFTVVGIGDMSGDVFGNGLLLSKHIKLIAAFNHMHIFIDPNPDAEKSFAERNRMFNLPRSTWEDYDVKLISAGGGIYRRSAKSIKLSQEVMNMLELTQDTIEPNALIRAILKAKVDLLWNGGIGTYVKASSENNNDVGDRTNDALRVNGNDLRCRVVGEGGNLGFTQLGRIEYALQGGMINTDFIDNSAGVDCSDHEVNIKILLNGIVASGDITEKQRNVLLAEMTDTVADLVLRDNYFQTQAISIAASQASANIDIYRRYMDEQERKGRIDRSLEFLPADQVLFERKAQGKGLTRPEIAILLAYSKTIIKGEIINSDLPEDPYLAKAIELEFPDTLNQRFPKQLEQHSLRREIIATQLSNALVNEMGIIFTHRLQNETGASVPSIVRAYTVAQKVFEMREIFSMIEALDYKIAAHKQIDMMWQVARMIRRATRWFLRNKRLEQDITLNIQRYAPGVAALSNNMSQWLTGKTLDQQKQLSNALKEEGIPDEVAQKIANNNVMFSALDIVEAALNTNSSIEELAKVYFGIGERLDLNWFRTEITSHAVENIWDGLARAALRDDIDWLQRNLAIGVMRLSAKVKDPKVRLERWQEQHKDLIERWESMLAELRSSSNLEFIVFYVAVRELLDLAQASLHAVKVDK